MIFRIIQARFIRRRMVTAIPKKNATVASTILSTSFCNIIFQSITAV